MSSKTRRAGGKEKWVSANDYKFETPQKMPRRTRQGRHLSIPSPWMHKANSQVKPGQVFSVKKTPIKKSSNHLMKKRSQNKRVRIFLDEETKPIKQKLPAQTPKIKQAVISLTDVKADDSKYTAIKSQDWIGKDDEMEVLEIDEAVLGIEAQNDSFDYKKPSKRRSARKFSPKNFTNGSSTQKEKTKKIMLASEKSFHATNDELDSYKLMTNGDHDDLSPSTNKAMEELTELEEVLTGELAKADLNADPKETSAAPGAKPTRSWCSIA